MGALADCERIANSLIGQPANALSALAFVIAGVIIARRRDLTWIGVAVAATGVGSFLFHGPMAPGGVWIHDTTLVWLIAVIAGWNRPWERWTRLPGLALLGVVFAGAPLVADPVAIALTGAALGLILIPSRSLENLGPVALLGVAAVVGRLGATGGPLCDPNSLLQAHAIWHIGAATAVTWWALARPKQHLSE